MKKDPDILTVTFNPAIDRVIEVEQLIPGQHTPAPGSSPGHASGGTPSKTPGKTPGGKGVNVSRVLMQMSIASTATGFLGKDNFATFAPLFKGCITDAFVVLPGSTRENITITETATGRDTHLRDRGLAVDAAALHLLRQKIKTHVNEKTIVIFSGSLPPGLTPNAFASLVDDCIDTGAKVAVDTSGNALRKMVGKKLWLAKPNASELADFAGHPLPSLDQQLQAARQMATNVQNVLLSCGSHGVYLVTAEQTRHAHVELGQPVKNTVGCGDTLLGSFVGSLTQGASPTEALTQATAIATASAAHRASATFDPKLAKTLKTKVILEAISI